jgi:hypothetical protein
MSETENDEINNTSISVFIPLSVRQVTHKQLTFSGKVSIFHQPIACFANATCLMLFGTHYVFMKVIRHLMREQKEAREFPIFHHRAGDRERSEWKIIIIINNTEALSSIKMIKNKQMSTRESIKVSPTSLSLRFHGLIDRNYSIFSDAEAQVASKHPLIRAK